MINSFLVALPVLIVVSGAAVTDLRKRRIPNVLTIPAIIAGVIFHSLTPWGEGWTFTLAGFALGAGLLLPPYLLGGGGMGDIKLLAALGAWLGPRTLLITFACGVLVAALFTIICLLTGKSFEELVRPVRQESDAEKSNPWRQERHAVRNKLLRNSRKALPFAIPLAVGTWLIVLGTALRGWF